MRSLVPVLLLAAGCATTPAPAATPAGPYALVLGTAQDAGLPQIGCDGPHCTAARADPTRRRLVTSVLIADPASGGRFLLDCSPDLPAQVERMRGHPPTRALPGARPPLVERVLLTHAHMGHYTGLVHFGPEAYGAEGVVVVGTARMDAFLNQEAPWSLLVELGTLDVRHVRPGDRLRLAEGLFAEVLVVPHRDELTDTVAWRIEGPNRTLLYLPDIDKWERWDLRLEDVLADVDVALLDGTFFADGEIPGRSIDDIPHPFISETLERLAPLPASERAKVLFTHLNHTNPASDPTSAAAASIRAAGMAVAREGQVLEL